LNSELPFVDEHQFRVGASRGLVWTALRRYVDSSLDVGGSHPLAWLLETEPRTGFEVTRDVPDQHVSTAGRHRFAVTCWCSSSPTLQKRRLC